MAEDLVRVVPEDEPEKDPKPAASATGDDSPPYQSRFQLVFGVLLGVAMAAVVATVLVIAGGRKQDDPGASTWAVWHPTTSDGLEAVNQIAEHVGQRYTLPSGNQLVAVRGGALELANLPVTIAIEQSGNVKILDEKGVLFNLCGLGENCSIKEGKPTYERSLVLRREALELALYTFRYIKNVDQVVTILPPRKGQKPGYAMFYRRDDVGASLNRPLAATLPGSPPIPPDVPKTEQAFINSLTSRNFFAFTPQEGGDAHIYLVLRPPSG
ncbi:MAG TPA: hypothetical protein VF066_07935 [Thermoleophilaceae bacterium]